MPTILRLGFIYVFGASLLLPCSVGIAQDFPNKPIRVISASSISGSTGLVMSALSPGISKVLGQNIVLEAMPGASGVVAIRYVKQSTPDGHTLLLMNSDAMIGELFIKDIGFEIRKDLLPVSLLADLPTYLVTPPTAPWNSMNELISYAKANPGRLNAGMTSPVSSTALSIAAIRQKYGLEIVDVYYKTGSPALVQAIRSNEIQLAVLGEPALGSAKVLAVAGAERSARFPELPSTLELGLPEITNLQIMLFAPAGTPKSAVDRLNAAIVYSMKESDAVSLVRKLGLQPIASSSEVLGKDVADNMSRLIAVAARAHIQPK